MTSPFGALALSECEPLRAYWEQVLAAEQVQFPADHIETGSIRRAQLDVPLSPATLAALRTYAELSLFDAFAFLFAGLAICLTRYSGGPIAICTPPLDFDDRYKSGGSAIPIITSIEFKAPVGNHISTATAMLKAAYARQRYPVRVPTGQVAGTAEPVPPDITFTCRHLHINSQGAGGGKLAWSWNGDAAAGSLRLDYGSDLFDQAFIEGVAQFLSGILDRMSTDETRPVIDILTDLVPRSLVGVERISGPRPGEDARGRLLAHFARQVAARSDKTALIWRDHRTSFRELDQMSEGRLQWLARAGVRSGGIVAISMRRSPAMIAMLLATIKSGAVYVFVAPGTPLIRVRAILDDTQATALVLEPDTFPEEAIGRETFCEDGLALIQLVQPADAGRLPAEAICVNYTSSSTGAPKGVVITADSIVNRLEWMWNAFPFSADDVMVLHKMPSLIGALWECYGGTFGGVTTIIASEDQMADPHLTWDLLARHSVTRLSASSSLLEILIDEASLPHGRPLALRMVFSSAEPLTSDTAMRWNAAFPITQLFNLYGATECSSNATIFPTSSLSARQVRVPIGRPIANTRVYVLDEALLPLPQGAIGELCIAGQQVAAGYLASPDLSAARFACEPGWTGFHQRMFRTGDLGRERASGDFELIGRQDHQVKIRGFRFDLTEVEAILVKHETVTKCAAQVWEGGENTVLAAYYMADTPLLPRELHAFASRFLPDYMIPGEFIHISTMPFTLHGKVDRKALPKPRTSSDLTAVAAEIRDHRLPLEEALRLIFATVLRLASVGLDDDLMALGSNSLNLIRIQRALRRVLERDVSVTALFAHPTARRLAWHLGGAHRDATPAKLIQSRAALQREANVRSRQRHMV